MHDSKNQLTIGKKSFGLFSLVLAGEAIFLLPFVLPRIFKPTLLDVFNITNTELGVSYSAYGVVAVFAYFFGGPLADRYPARKLMSMALVVTGLGGFYLSSIPDISSLFWLYASWGLSTILLFWASLMRITRVLGENAQGLAFGTLEGGRGAVAAIVGSIGVGVLAWFLPEAAEVTSELRMAAFQKVILFFSSVVIVAAVLVALALRGIDDQEREDRVDLAHVGRVAGMPEVWLQALIILCAYTAYRVTDDFSLLAKEVLKYEEVQAAGLGTVLLWLRPIAAITAGLIADRVSASRMILYCFAALVLAGVTMGFGPVGATTAALVISVVAATSIAVFALRGLYFAIMHEAKIPVAVTGTVVGVASIVGYLPDIFMAPLMGHLLDADPGLVGHQNVFLVMSVFALIGLFAAIMFRRVVKKS